MGLKPVMMKPERWESLKAQMLKDYPTSWTLIRTKQRHHLGFTVRRHTEYADTRQLAGEFGLPEYGSRRQPRQMICLDFYDEPKRTMFLLKYSDWIKQ